MTQVVVCGRGRAGRGGVGGGDRQLSVLVSWSACAQLSPSTMASVVTVWGLDF